MQRSLQRHTGSMQWRRGATPGDKDSTMQSLADQGAFGPLAAIIVGWSPGEVAAFNNVMQQIGAADLVKVVTVSKLDVTLQQAAEGPPGELVEPEPNTPKVVFLSGMSGGEVIEVVEACMEADGIPQTAWAAAVPKNWNRKLGSLVDEIAKETAMARLYNKLAEPKQ